MPYSARLGRFAPKVLVSTASQPVSKYASWIWRTTSGRVTLRISLQPSWPSKSSRPRSCAWSIVPIAPSATTTRSRSAASRLLSEDEWLNDLSLPARTRTTRPDKFRLDALRPAGYPRGRHGQLQHHSRRHRRLGVGVSGRGTGSGRRGRHGRDAADRLGVHRDERPRPRPRLLRAGRRGVQGRGLAPGR